MRYTRIIFAFFLFCCTLQLHAINGICRQTSEDRIRITAIAETNCFFWVGTTDGLWKINKKNFHREHMTTGNSMLPSDDVSGICIEDDNNIWIGTAAGILRYDNYAFYVMNSKNSNLPDDRITALATDAAGNVWIGTAGGGLVQKLRYGRFTVYNTTNARLQDNAILSITPDDNGNIWVAVQDNGIALVQSNKWATLDAKSGFEGRNILFVAKDNTGYNMYCANGDQYIIADKKITKNSRKYNIDDVSLRYTVGGDLFWLHGSTNAMMVTAHGNDDAAERIKTNFRVIDSVLFTRTIVLNP